MRMFALFTNNGVPVIGLTLAEIHFTVHAVKRSDNSVTTPVAAQDAIVETGGGYYMYNYAAADFELYDYVWWAQYTGVMAVDSAYVFGNTDAIAGVDDLSGFTTAGKAEVQAEVEDALAAHGGVGVALVGEAAAALASWVSAYAAPLLRILGLVQENQIVDTTVFDVDGHMTSARLRTFTDATLTVVLATYTTTATYDISGNMTNFQVVKV